MGTTAPITQQITKATLRRRQRRLRSQAKRLWYLHRHGFIQLSEDKIKRLYQQISTHHSKDPGLLRQLRAAMAQLPKAPPWKCRDCRKLAKATADYCPHCGNFWSSCWDKNYVHQNGQLNNYAGDYRNEESWRWPSTSRRQPSASPRRRRKPSQSPRGQPPLEDKGSKGKGNKNKAKKMRAKERTFRNLPTRLWIHPCHLKWQTLLQHLHPVECRHLLPLRKFSR